MHGEHGEHSNQDIGRGTPPWVVGARLGDEDTTTDQSSTSQNTDELFEVVHALVYISWATRPMLLGDFVDILRHSRHNNGEHGITGILMYKNGIFLQYIEGSEDKLQGLLNKIKNDRRHQDINVLEFSSIGSRYFPSWQMELGSFEYLANADIGTTHNQPLRVVQAFIRDFL
jgi:hypothetical protein